MTKRKKKANGRITLSVRINDEDKKRAMDNARKFAKGNLSAWARHAILNHVPKLVKNGEKL